MAHIIILEEMELLQGENVTGSGLAQRVVTATEIAHGWEEYPNQTEDTEAVAAHLETGATLIENGYTSGTLTTWVADLEELNSKCP